MRIRTLFMSALATMTLALAAGALAQSKGTVVRDVHYGTPATLMLPLVNTCETAERVQISLLGFSFIGNVPAKEILQPGETKQIAVPVSPPPLPTGQAAQNLTRSEKGVLEYRFEGRDAPACQAHTERWDVVINLTPPAPGSPSPPALPQPAAPRSMTDPCAQWWQTGQPPARATSQIETACVPTIQALATTYADRVLSPLAALEPVAWAWLPSEDALARMTIVQLLAFKKRAVATLDGK